MKDVISIKPAMLGSRDEEYMYLQVCGAYAVRCSLPGERSANQSYCSTGPFKKGNVSVRASTLDKEATNATGNVQKMHNAAVNMRLMSSPTKQNKT